MVYKVGCAAGCVVVVGGLAPDSEADLVEDKNVADVCWCLHTDTWQWERLPGGPSPRSGCAAVASTEECVIVFGGATESSEAAIEDVCWKLHLGTKQWQEVEGGPSPRYDCAAVAMKGRVLLLGGLNDHQTLAQDVCWQLTDATTGERGLSSLPLLSIVVLGALRRAWKTRSVMQEDGRCCALQPRVRALCALPDSVCRTIIEIALPWKL